MVKKILPIIFLFILASILLLVFTYELAYLHKIYPNVKISGIPVGNLNKQDAQQKIRRRVTADLPANITLTDGQQNWTIATKTLKIEFDYQTAAEGAYQIGRRGSLKQRFQEKIAAWQGKIDQNLPLSFSQGNLDNHIDVIEKNVRQEGQPFYLSIQNDQIQVHPSQPGQALNKRKTKNLIIQQIKTRQTQPISLPVTAVNPPLEQKEINQIVQTAQNLLGKKLVLRTEQELYVWPDVTLISLLHPNELIFRERLTAKIDELAEQVKKPAQNALFKFDSGRVTTFQEAQTGQALIKDEALPLLEEKLQQLEKESGSQVTIKLPVRTVSPEITTAAANNLGIKEKIGQGVSYFRGSIAPRVHNIKTAAAQFNGILVAPEETFSFNKTLGEVTQATGYQTAYVIKDGRTQKGVGGGVCQVSTTFFRAALNAGLPILERQAHAYRVSYYEQESKVGFDATVYSPQPDLKIENNTPAHILIQTEFYPKEYKLVFEVFGTDDGREVEISNYKTWGSSPPPPPLYIEDDTLPAGEVKQIDWPAWGLKAQFDWKVTKNDQTIAEETFYSNYRPWQAVYLKGIKED